MKINEAVFMKKLMYFILPLTLFTSYNYANEVNSDWGDRSWQFRTPYERNVKLGVAITKEKMRNPDSRLYGPGRLGGAGGSGMLGGGSITIQNAEIGVVDSSSNCLNCSNSTSVSTNYGNGATVTSGTSTSQTNGNNTSQSNQSEVSGNTVTNSGAPVSNNANIGSVTNGNFCCAKGGKK